MRRYIRLGDFANEPGAWAGVAWGLIEGFKHWQLGQGYAVGTINRRLATVKAYTALAAKAGVLTESEAGLIRLVKAIGAKEGRRLDTRRRDNDLPTRLGLKKVEAVSINREQATALKAQPDTSQGRRDALLICLLLDHGLRCGEVAGLQVSDFDLKAGELRFYRPKVALVQTHRLTHDTFHAARAYLDNDAPAEGSLLRVSRKDGRLHGAGMSERAITRRVATLGEAVGLKRLSAHDCRHFWATLAARNGTPIDRLQDAGGWASPAMPLQYVERAKISNEGVKLG